LPSSNDAALAKVFDKGKKQAPELAKLAFAYGKQGFEFDDFASAARSLVFMKATDPHGYKYPAAVFEDYDYVSPQWRPHMLATSVYYLPQAGTPDSPLMKQARDAVASLT
jgi:hypothetical protein